MARLLLGWELGSGSGHLVKLAGLARALVADGHAVEVAAQQLGPLPEGVSGWQAPLWPQQITALARPTTVAPATMGDILAGMGLAQRDAIVAMVAAWDRIISAVKPDLALAEYAPGLQLAAWGRLPLVTLGTGFSLPPPELQRFASLTGEPAVTDEAGLLDVVNAALRGIGRPPLPKLTAIFSADRILPATFRETDPYRQWRTEPLVAPSAARVDPVDGRGDELFAYMNGAQTRPPAFWQGLVLSGVPVRVHDARLAPADADRLEAAGVTVERRPLPFARIASRARLILSHGGLGFVSAGLAAGLPQIVMPFDIEKEMTARSLVEIGTGRIERLDGLDAQAFADNIRSAYEDAGFGEAARAHAPSFQTRLMHGNVAATIEAVREVLG